MTRSASSLKLRFLTAPLQPVLLIKLSRGAGLARSAWHADGLMRIPLALASIAGGGAGSVDRRCTGFTCPGAGLDTQPGGADDALPGTGGMYMRSPERARQLPGRVYGG